jgi:hypothetical protein
MEVNKHLVFAIKVTYDKVCIVTTLLTMLAYDNPPKTTRK